MSVGIKGTMNFTSQGKSQGLNSYGVGKVPKAATFRGPNAMVFGLLT
jgi:hypothetical protein